MLPRSSTPPTSSRSSSSTRRGISRGGVQKRWAGPTRVDKDGDLVMDPADGGEMPGRGRPEGAVRHSQGRTLGRVGHKLNTPHGNHTSQQTQQSVLRGLESHHPNILESRTSRSILGNHEVITKSQTPDLGANICLRVRGLKESKAASNPDGGMKDLLNFLERKASGLDAEPRRGVRIKKSYLEDGNVIITVSSEDSGRILKLNNFKFAGATLLIELHQPLASTTSTTGDKSFMSQNAKDTENRIKAILSTRYDANLKLLNLSALGRDPGLVQMGMFDGRNRISKLFPVLMVVCDRLFTSPEQKSDAINSISLADNDLDSVSVVTALAQTFPDLQNLDLSRNRISELRALESWRWKFQKLQNLEITGNPIEAAMPEYSQEIIKWYPTLQVINGVTIRRPQEAVIVAEVKPQTQRTENLTPIPTSGPDFRDANQVGEGFIRQFFTLYDNDRSSLIRWFYDTNSVFSVSINVSAPRSERSSPSHPFSSIQFKQSRNLIKVKSPHAQITRIFRGVEAIKSIWLQFPPTMHEKVESPSTKYLIDCHPIPGLADPSCQSPKGVDGLIVMVHGEYEEQDSTNSTTSQRSFSRTFVLGPGSPAGPSVRVISDTLMLRAWGPLSLPLASRDSTVQASGQEGLTRQLAIQTQMTPEYAEMCLAETGWNLHNALIAFNANKSKLPPNAFVNHKPDI